MPALTTEVLIFDANDAFRDNPDLPIPAFQVALRAKGVHAPTYYGKRIEEPSTSGYIFLNWESYEAHKALIDGPTYPDVIGGLKPALADDAKIEMYHVQFSGPTVALEKPVTEVVILTLKAPENRTAVVDILTKFSETSEKILVFGQAREDENKYVVLCGWPSVEAHLETAAKPEVAKAVEQLYSLADRDHCYHTKLSQYRL